MFVSSIIFCRRAENLPPRAAKLKYYLTNLPAVYFCRCPFRCCWKLHFSCALRPERAFSVDGELLALSHLSSALLSCTQGFIIDNKSFRRRCLAYFAWGKQSPKGKQQNLFWVNSDVSKQAQAISRTSNVNFDVIGRKGCCVPILSTSKCYTGWFWTASYFFVCYFMSNEQPLVLQRESRKITFNNNNNNNT